MKDIIKYSEDGKTVIGCDPSSEETIVVPEGVTHIEANAFACQHIRGITLPTTLEFLGNECFIGCSNLEHIVIPRGIKTLSMGLFEGCTALKEVQLPGHLTQETQLMYMYYFCIGMDIIQYDYSENAIQQNHSIQVPLNPQDSKTNIESILSIDWISKAGIGLILDRNNYWSIRIAWRRAKKTLIEQLKIEILDTLELDRNYPWIIWKEGLHTGLFYIIIQTDSFQKTNNASVLWRPDDFELTLSLKNTGYTALPPMAKFTSNKLPHSKPQHIQLRNLYALVEQLNKNGFQHIVNFYQSHDEEFHLLVEALQKIQTKEDEKESNLYIFFDTETTGVPKNYQAPSSDTDNWPRLVQLGWILTNENGKALNSGNLIIRPEGFTIPEEASRVHRISTEQALREGISLQKAIEAFIHNLNLATYVVGHNIDFDKKVVGAEMIRLGLKDILDKKSTICTMLSTIDFCKIPGNWGYKWPKLQELYVKLFGHKFDNAHDAASDIEATKECFFELRKRGIV